MLRSWKALPTSRFCAKPLSLKGMNGYRLHSSRSQGPQDHAGRANGNTEFAAGATGLAVWMACLMFSDHDSTNDTHEITLHELVKEYVAKGYVTRLQVVNRSVCMAQVHREAETVAGARRGPEVVSVQLNGLRSFEDKFEELQFQLGRQRSDFVPIQYVTKSDVSSKVLLSLAVMIPFAIAVRRL
eukprot:TRINITY_DN66187_c0_g1_i1.p1 TRINITY_DN66187_c0_g1~~TRINITY_DN66187_c0_g1_i1.p1  ORF type:complete len:201 (+),score=31.83 TRINITY_DN66187_c0_g1_i1:49-603(+)